MYFLEKRVLLYYNNIDPYSDLGNETFEPREDMKGNIARANFTFIPSIEMKQMQKIQNFSMHKNMISVSGIIMIL